MRRRRTVAALVVAGTLTGTGCALSDGVEAVGEDPVILVHHADPDAVTISIALGGHLGYDPASRCLRFGHGEKVQTPVWPSGTRPVLRNGKRGVHIRGVGDLLEGDRFEAGLAGSIGELPGKLPASCVPEDGHRALRHITKG